MAYCANCGLEVEENDKYCPRCGLAVRKIEDSDNSNNNTKRKVVFEGELKKCPNCGEVLNSFTTNCPSCGYELRNIQATNSVKELSEKIQKIEATKPRGKGIKSRLVREEIDKEITNLVTSFPIPNSKEDIMEFMILASSNIDVSKAWLPKVDQAYVKAKSILGSDSEMLQIEKLYKTCKKKIRWKKSEDLRWLFGVILGLVIIISIPFIYTGIHRTFFAPEENSNEESRLTAIVEDAESALADHDYKLALRIVESMKYKAYDDDRKRW